MRIFNLLAVMAILALPIAVNASQSDLNWANPHTLQTPRQSPVIDAALNQAMAGRPDAKFHVWVFLTDKGIDNLEQYNQALRLAEASLTAPAYERRLKARGADNLVDFRDLPVYPPYIAQALSSGAGMRQALRWFNAVSVEATPDQIAAIAELSFVRAIAEVHGLRADFNVPRQPISEPGMTLLTLNYGPSLGQINQINVVPAHELGFKGQGVIVCMMDVGYKLNHDAFQPAINDGRMLAQYDFINHDYNTDYDPNQDSSLYQADHGTLTWSTLGGEAAGQLYGPSYLSTFILAKTENISSERHIEEDNWAAGAEWADSIGASVISSSLGYRIFDSGQGDYQYSDLDGNTAIVTIAADLAAYNGITVCNAMGNEGNSNGSLIAPADADSILSCGAVDGSGYLAYFSSWGPTYDGRIKPEVCAQGQGTVCANPDNMNGYTTASGTSLSTPLVGGASGVLLSAHPNWTPMMVREALMMTADRFDAPDNDYGWGIMDVSRALYYHPQGDIVFSHRPLIVATPSQPITFDVNIVGGTAPLSASLYFRNGMAGDFTQVNMSTSNGQDFTAQIPGQSGSAVQYYFKAVDVNNVLAFNPVGDSAHPYSIGLGASAFTDSIEDGMLYWESGGRYNLWGLSAKYSRSGALSLTDSPTTNYRDSTDSWIRSDFILDLSRVSSANLSFYWRGVLQTSADYVYIEGSTDGGNTWSQFPQTLNGSVFSFTQYTADLSSYIGFSNVRLRFHLITNGSTRREGLYIDDITISWAPTGVGDSPVILPRDTRLSQNYPNPFNPSTVISFSLPVSGNVELAVYDLLGQKVKTLVSGMMTGGDHEIVWDGRNQSGDEVASGVYLYKLQTGGQSQVKRMTLVR